MASESGRHSSEGKGVHGSRRTLKKRKQQDGFYPLFMSLQPVDLKKLAAINEEFCCDSDSHAARIALKRWYRWLLRQSQRPDWISPERPEFAVKSSPNSGGKSRKIYATKEDMARLDELAVLTGKKGFAQLFRAAIGWMYENLDI